jgi:cytochrome c5
MHSKWLHRTALTKGRGAGPATYNLPLCSAMFPLAGPLHSHRIMSDAQQPHDAQQESHEGFIRTPKQLMAVVVASFVLPVVIIIMMANYVALESKAGAGGDALGPEAVARRLQPVGHVEIRDASSAAAMKTGEQVYQQQCVACHGAGVAGAPKLGDAPAWQPRLATGFDALLNSVLKGKGAMAPQRGGDFSDFEIARAVTYIANQGGGKFAEPAAPTAAGASAAGK